MVNELDASSTNCSSSRLPAKAMGSLNGHVGTKLSPPSCCASSSMASVGADVESVSPSSTSLGTEVESDGTEVESDGTEVESVGLEVESVGLEVESVGLEVESVGAKEEGFSDPVVRPPLQLDNDS